MLKSVKRQLYRVIMCRHFSRMHKDKDSGRALGLDPFFRNGFMLFLLFFTCFYSHFILEF